MQERGRAAIGQLVIRGVPAPTGGPRDGVTHGDKRETGLQNSAFRICAINAISSYMGHSRMSSLPLRAGGDLLAVVPDGQVTIRDFSTQSPDLGLRVAAIWLLRGSHRARCFGGVADGAVVVLFGR